MSITEHEQRDSSINSRDRAKQEESFGARVQLPRRFIWVWGNSIVMVLAIAAGIVMLSRFAVQVSKQDQEFAHAEPPAGGIIVRSYILHAWIPPTIMELANPRTQSEEIRTHEVLRRILELRRQKDLWYAVTHRAHMANGDFVDLPYVRQPYKDDQHFSEFLEVLAAAAAHSPGEPADPSSTVTIQILSDEQSKVEARSVLAEMQRNPHSLAGLARQGDEGGNERPR